MTNRTWTIQLIGVLLLILLLLYSIPIITHKITIKIANNVEEILHKQGYSWVRIIVTGRDIIAAGQTASVREHQEVIDQINNIWFIKNIQDEITPVIIKPYTLNLHWDGTTLSLNGYIDSQRSKQSIEEYIQQYFTGNEIKENLQIGIGSPEHWYSLIKVLLQQIKKLSLASIQVIDHNIEIRGKVQNSKQIEKLEKSLMDFKNRYHYKLSNQVIALDQPALICQKRFDTLLKGNNIKFKVGSSVIDNSSDDLLVALANVAALCVDSSILIIGHADNLGNEQDNIDLSLQRAKAVKGRLFSRGGIPLKVLEIEGKGSSEPIDSNNTKQGQKNNRRIEFIVKGL